MALFEISVAVNNGQARFSFMWNRHMEHQAQIRQWVSKCRDTLADLVVRLADHRREPTLSDFPLLPTDYSGLAKHVDETFHEIGISTLDEVEDMYICAPTQEGLLLSQIRNPTQYVNFVISHDPEADDTAHSTCKHISLSAFRGRTVALIVAAPT